jgi:lipopolysaccharide/colanic/teichoic acid biosynthesis glycosyltransferase
MFLQHRAGVSASHYLRWKLPLERALGALLLLMSLPILGALVLLVRATSAGPGIYRQPRVGKGGRVFSVYKIRTMRQDAEKDTGPVWSSQGRDPRVTGLGRWLRALHLDELPQLFNVACGDMALIGPRPERPEFVEVLQRHIPGYLDRLVVVPGITGLAQVNLPPDEALEGVWLKTTADLEYIRHASPSMDVKILAATVLRLFGRKISWYVPGRHGVSRANRSEEGVERQGPRADVLPMRDWHRRSRPVPSLLPLAGRRLLAALVVPAYRSHIRIWDGAPLWQLCEEALVPPRADAVLSAASPRSTICSTGVWLCCP